MSDFIEVDGTTVADALGVETLRVLALSALDELDRLVPLVDRLVLTHQRGIGFMTAEAKAVQDEMIRTDRAARYPGRDRAAPVGHAFLRSGGMIVASGDRPAPGNITAYSMLAEAHVILTDMVRHLTRRLQSQGVCLITGAPAEPDLRQLVKAAGDLIRVLTNVDLLDAAGQQTEYLVEKAKRIVDGDDKKKHPDPCPHCRRQTLVIYLTKGVIRCEEDPVSGSLMPCHCTDPYCQCRFRAHRHEWHRQPATKTQRSWWHLRDLLTIRERENTDKQGDEA